MLNTKFTFISYPHFQKLSLGSSKYGLSYSLQGHWRSSSKFTHLLIMDSPDVTLVILNHDSEICSCPKDIFKFDICNFSKSMSLFDSNLWGLKIPFVNTHSYESKTMIVCKFWTFPPTPFEAVAETILAWSQWNFQISRVRYESWFGI